MAQGNSLTVKALIEQYKNGVRNFQSIDLHGISFENVDLRGADFTKAQFTDVTFVKVKLSDTNFSEATLSNVLFEDSILNKAKFYNARRVFHYAPLSSEASQGRTDFLTEKLQGEEDFQDLASQVKFERSKLHSVDFTKAKLPGVVFHSCNISMAKFSNAILENCNFSDSNIYQSNFSKAAMQGSEFEGVSFIATWWSTIGLSFLNLLACIGATIIFILSCIPLYQYYEASLQKMLDSDPIRVALNQVILITSLLFYLFGIRVSYLKRIIVPLVGIGLVLAPTLNQPLVTSLAFVVGIIWFSQIIRSLLALSNKLISGVLFFSILCSPLVILYAYSFLEGLFSEEAPRGAVFSNIFLLAIVTLGLSVIFINFTSISLNLLIEKQKFNDKGRLKLIPSIWLSLKSFPVLAIPLILLLLLIFLQIFVVFYSCIPVFSIAIDYLSKDRGEDIPDLYHIYFTFVFMSGGFFPVLSTLILSRFSSFCVVEDRGNFKFIRDFIVWITHFRRSSVFRGTDLKQSSFINAATLKNADFSGANLDQVIWVNAGALEYARFGQSYLRYSQVRHFLRGQRQVITPNEQAKHKPSRPNSV